MSAALAFVPTAVPDTWLTKEEIARRTGLTPRSINRYAEKGKTKFREISTRSGNGRPIREFQVLSLPAEIRIKLAPPQQVRPQMMLAAPQRGIGLLFDEAPAAERPGHRISLPPAAERQALDRLGVIQPLLDYSVPGNRARYALLKVSDGRSVTTADLLADYIAETRSIGGKAVVSRTLWRWVKAYRAGGIPALARKPREDQGSSHFFARYPAAAALASAEYLKPFATIQRAFEAIGRDRKLLGIPNAELPAYGTVKRFLDSLPAPIAILARQGQRRYNETCAPHVARAYTDIPANDTWVADHMIHDVEVRNDCFTGAPMHAPMRLQLTAIMDMRSRKFVGYCWTVAGDSRSIATALRRAVARYGPCVTFYCDNGRDFKKAARGAEPLRPSKESVQLAMEDLVRRGAVQRLGMNVQYCIPYLASISRT